MPPDSASPRASTTSRRWWHAVLETVLAVGIVFGIHYAFTHLTLGWAIAASAAGCGVAALVMFVVYSRTSAADPAMQALSKDIDAMASLARSVASTRGLSCPDCGQDLHAAAKDFSRIDDAANCPNPECGAPFTMESARAYWGFDPRGEFTGPPRLELRHRATLPSVEPGRQTQDWLETIESDPALKKQVEDALKAHSPKQPPPDAPPPAHKLP